MSLLGEGGVVNRALLIGINRYESIGHLRGCINDVTNVRHLLLTYFGFKVENISVLVDSSAQRARIEKRINWLFDGAQSGGNLVLHFSGHGSYIRDFNGDEGRRKLNDTEDELICLYNMDWRNRDSYIIDDDLGEWLKKKPDGVDLTVILDSCHSGTGTREVGLAPPPHLAPYPASHPGHGRGKDAPPVSSSGGIGWNGGGNGGGISWSGERSLAAEVQSRFQPPPVDIALRIDEREVLERRRLGSGKPSSPLNHTLLSGCRDDQTSADAYIGGGYNGAFTYYLCKTVREAQGQISQSDLISRVRQSLQFKGFEQRPQLNGPKGFQQKRFLR